MAKSRQTVGSHKAYKATIDALAGFPEVQHVARSAGDVLYQFGVDMRDALLGVPEGAPERVHQAFRVWERVSVFLSNVQQERGAESVEAARGDVFKAAGLDVPSVPVNASGQAKA